MLDNGATCKVEHKKKSVAQKGRKMGSLFASIMKLLISLATLGCAVYLGLKLEPEKDISERALLIMGVGFSTFSPLGLFLYVKFWESKPEFSATCGKQAIVGLLCFACFSLLTHFFPPVIERW